MPPDIRSLLIVRRLLPSINKFFRCGSNPKVGGNLKKIQKRNANSKCKLETFHKKKYCINLESTYSFKLLFDKSNLVRFCKQDNSCGNFFNALSRRFRTCTCGRVENSSTVISCILKHVNVQSDFFMKNLITT